MADLRKLARGRECQIQIPGICNHNPETVVLCHLPSGSMGGKSPDLLGAWGCFDCHNAVDRRDHRRLDADYVRHFFLEGVIRTQRILIQEGHIHA